MRLTRNQFSSGGVGSNPTRVETFFLFFGKFSFINFLFLQCERYLLYYVASSSAISSSSQQQQPSQEN